MNNSVETRYLSRPRQLTVWPTLLMAALAVTLSATPTMSAASSQQADLVVVRKSDRTLSLVRKNEVIKSFRISLGADPIGHKIKAGDSRTPEGRYFIEYKNPESRFNLSLKISYPNADDRSRAHELGLPAGGNIMIHGLPNTLRRRPDYYYHFDWTDGCIAVSNTAIRQIWEAVDEHTPIVIYP